MYRQEWERLSPAEKKEELYLRQVRLLQTFLQHGAISQEQFEKSFHDLTEKMGMQHVKESSSLDLSHHLFSADESVCSACGYLADKPQPTCPHCGAVMGGEAFDPSRVDEAAMPDIIPGGK